MPSHFVTFTVRPGAMDAFLELASANARGSRTEPGCMAFDVYRDPEAPRVILHEKFASAAALDAHRETDHFKRFMAAMPALTVGDRVRQDLMPVDVADA